jgi:3alpha(or 20beta)-hydroxysteroid dehydrogenase
LKRLDGKVALVTGAARGQGAAEVDLFRREGAIVIATDVKPEQDDASVIEHDVSDEQRWKAIVNDIQDRYGRLDILVNNAGQIIPTSLLDADAALMEKLWRINYLGGFFGIQAVTPLMQQGGGGSIVNISSVGGLSGTTNSVAYGSAKWATRGLSRTAARDLAADGIRVNTIIPGLIETGMLMDSAPEGFAEMAASMVPHKRLGRPAEVAAAVLFLASDEASYISGAELTVDGGLMA